MAEPSLFPTRTKASFVVVPLNRGAWWPFCTTQLRQLQREHDRFTAAGVEVVLIFVDDEATAGDLVDSGTRPASPRGAALLRATAR